MYDFCAKFYKMSLKISELIGKKSFSYSCEVTPDLKYSELNILVNKPIFYSVTWHAKSHRCKDLNISPLELAYKLRSDGINVMLHLSCDLLKKSFLDQLLKRLQEVDIRNLFVVLGEGYDSTTSDFKSTQDLIKYIKKKTGTFFCIGVSAFPNSDDRLPALKEKVECGADFIITQAIFDTNIFTEFLEKCNNMHIHAPIIPGIYLFETNQELKRFIELCKVDIPKTLLDEAERQESGGYDIVKNVIAKIQSQNNVNHFHFFTLNKFIHVSKIVD